MKVSNGKQKADIDQILEEYVYNEWPFVDDVTAGILRDLTEEERLMVILVADTSMRNAARVMGIERSRFRTRFNKLREKIARRMNRSI